MKFIVIEGLDGAGKSTQLQLLRDELTKLGKKFYYLHFPRTDSPVFGDLVARFLRGEFGKNEDVNPYLVALLYAGDRKDAADTILQYLKDGTYIIADRYVYSNIAYQCAKFTNKSDRETLKKWILDLEYNYYKIPKPDLNLFLDVPFQFTHEKLTDIRNGEDRDYLNGNYDIHEKDLNFQKFVRDVYLDLASGDEKLKIINCGDKENSMLPPSVIFHKILELINMENLLNP